jgi:hypothetical protein
MAPKRPAKPAKRMWRASLIKKRTVFLGYVHAPDREAAEAVAIEEYKLTDLDRRRLVIQEQP